MANLQEVIALRNNPDLALLKKKKPQKAPEIDFTAKAVEVIKNALEQNQRDLIVSLNEMANMLARVSQSPSSSDVVRLYTELNENLRSVAGKIQKVADNPPKVVDNTQQINSIINQLDRLSKKETSVFFDPQEKLVNAIEGLRKQQETSNKLLARSDQRTKDIKEIRDSLKDSLNEAKKQIKIEPVDLSELEKIMTEFMHKALDKPAFKFDVKRDHQGLITTIEATPQGKRI